MHVGHGTCVTNAHARLLAQSLFCTRAIVKESGARARERETEILTTPLDTGYHSTYLVRNIINISEQNCLSQLLAFFLKMA